MRIMAWVGQNPFHSTSLRPSLRSTKEPRYLSGTKRISGTSPRDCTTLTALEEVQQTVLSALTSAVELT